MGEIDITELDLARLVIIKKKSAEVYPKETEHLKPSSGLKLNRPAIITLFGSIRPKEGQKLE